MRGIVGKALLAASGPRMRAIARWQADPVPAQERLLHDLIRRAADTRFGREHGFASIRSVRDFQERAPLRSYLDFKPYWDRLLEGEADVTWPGRIRYLAETSGTTAGNKLIPVSDEGIASHLRAGADILNFYLTQTRDTDLFSGKFLFMGGSTSLTEHLHGLLSGDLSGVMTREMPWYVAAARIPSRGASFMTNWEKKLDAIAAESRPADVRGISGTPSWLVCLFERVLKLQRVAGRPANTLADVWPNLSLLIHGGVSYEPYRKTFAELFGKPVHTLETYPASEGFVAIQDDLDAPDLLLMMDLGIFFEFVPAEELESARPRRFTVANAEKGVNYAIVLTTNSGLWSYVIGDTVRFASLRPHKVRVTGRTQHFLSAFGEHLIVEEAEAAVTEACEATGAEIQDFHVAPLYPSAAGMKPAHQWLVEFLKLPAAPDRFRDAIDDSLRRRNPDYAAHRQGDAGMSPPQLVSLPAGTFYRAMKEAGKLGGQHKVPRMKNNRDFAEQLLKVQSAGNA